MNQTFPKFTKVDSAMYSLSILLGISIVLINQVQPPQNMPSMMDSYMVKVLSRMDSVSGQLARWESQDVSQYR